MINDNVKNDVLSLLMSSKEFIIIKPNTQIMFLFLLDSNLAHKLVWFRHTYRKPLSNEQQIKQTIIYLFICKYAAESKLMTMNSDVVKDSAFILILLACSGVFINQVIVCINRYISMDTSVATELERY